jgi:hypothetical protein
MEWQIEVRLLRRPRRRRYLQHAAEDCGLSICVNKRNKQEISMVKSKLRGQWMKQANYC